MIHKPRYRIEYITFGELLREVKSRKGTIFYAEMMAYRPESNKYQFITRIS